MVVGRATEALQNGGFLSETYERGLLEFGANKIEATIVSDVFTFHITSYSTTKARNKEPRLRRSNLFYRGKDLSSTSICLARHTTVGCMHLPPRFSNSFHAKHQKHTLQVRCK